MLRTTRTLTLKQSYGPIRIIPRPLHLYGLTRQFRYFSKDHSKLESVDEKEKVETKQNNSTEVISEEKKSIFKKLFYHIEPLLDKRNINFPNFLSFSRIIITPFICYFIMNEQHTLAFVSFAYASAADFFDGYLARKWKQTTVLGGFLDPVGDKVLVAGLTITYAWIGLIPPWLLALIVGRDVALVAMVNIMRVKTKSKDAAYFDHTGDAKFEIQPTLLGKINMGGCCMLLATCMTHHSWVK